MRSSVGTWKPTGTATLDEEPTRGDRIRFFDRVREGRIEICALPFSMHTEAYSIDELARQLRFAEDLREQYDVPIQTAMQTDVPGATIGLLTSLVDADVRYLSVAHNYAGRSARIWSVARSLHVPSTGAPPTANACWCGTRTRRTAARTWRATWSVWRRITRPPSRDCRAIWRPLRSSLPVPGAWGEHLRMDGPGSLLQRHESALSSRCAPPEGAGRFSDNASPNIVPAEIVREWNEKWAYPQLRLATNSEFFAEAEEACRSIETYSGDWTDWWVDGIGSGARHLGFNRRAQADVRTAQTLHTLANALTDDGADRRDEIDEIYESMALFDEHTWGPANPWMDGLERRESGALQWETKAGFARDAREDPTPSSGRASTASRTLSDGPATHSPPLPYSTPAAGSAPTSAAFRAREPHCTPAPPRRGRWRH